MIGLIESLEGFDSNLETFRHGMEATTDQQIIPIRV